MILIADSGSTKCDWLLLKGAETVLECNTMGFNPYFHDQGLITKTMAAQADLAPYAGAILRVFFYGAGCSNPALNSVVQKGLMAVFPNAEVQVGHDLSGAALATYQGVPHIACILGTGSNSCFFDGKEVSEEIPALAYILGDEGSGSYYGKRLLADFLYRRMPAQLQAAFYDTYRVTKDIVMENVYMRPNANVYLAGFMKFCTQHKTEPYIRNMVKAGTMEFLRTHVLCFKQCHEVPVNFVGSVAYYFEDILGECASELNLNIGKVVKKPIHGLVDYHLKYSFLGVI